MPDTPTDVAIEEMRVQVARDKEVKTSAATLLRKLKGMLEAGADDPATIREIAASLGSESDALASAVVENTPAE